MGNELCKKHFFTKQSDTNHPPMRKSPEIIHVLNVVLLKNNNNTACSS